MNCNYSDKIMKIIEEGKKCNCNSVIVGPTGPAGPATITIGTTTTGDSGTEASVTNVGTSENVILNFVIPQGPTGPTGPTGPEGTSSLSAYGRIYDVAENDIVLTANTAKSIPLGSAGPLSNITLGNDNTLLLEESGTYLIDYYFSGSSNVTTQITIEVVQNSNPIGNTTITKDVTANEDIDFSGSTIITLTENDKIGLEIESQQGATITPSTGTSAYLNILKLS